MASGSPSPAAATLTCRLGPDRVTKPIRTCGTQVAKTHASFDDPNLVSHAGLVPVMALAQRAGLGALAATSPGTSQPPPGPPRCSGYSPSAFTAPRNCSNPPTPLWNG